MDAPIFNLSIPLLDTNDTIPDKKNVIKNASITHFKFEFLFFFACTKSS
jgi:hypothetical protein